MPFSVFVFAFFLFVIVLAIFCSVVIVNAFFLLEISIFSFVIPKLFISGRVQNAYFMQNEISDFAKRPNIQEILDTTRSLYFQTGGPIESQEVQALATEWALIQIAEKKST